MLTVASPTVFVKSSFPFFGNCHALSLVSKMLALGNQVGKLYVWDLEIEDPHKAK